MQVWCLSLTLLDLARPAEHLATGSDDGSMRMVPGGGGCHGLGLDLRGCLVGDLSSVLEKKVCLRATRDSDDFYLTMHA